MSDQKENPVVRPLAEIITITASMATIFAAFSISFPTSLISPILGLLLGLVVTGVFLKKGKINFATAITTWMVVAVLVLAAYLVVSQSATVEGRVVDSQNSPIPGGRLILTDSSGVDHKSVTDESGVFEFRNIPQGKYTILIDNELLISGEIPSGWQRIFYPRVRLPASVFHPPETATPTPTVLPTMTASLEPTLPSTVTVTPSGTPKPVCKVEDFEGTRRKVTWFSPDPQVFSYAETDMHAHSGTQSFRVVYNKTNTYQFISAVGIGCCFPHGSDQELRVWVYGDVTMLVKLEDENLKQAEIGIGHATNAEDWTLLTFDYSNVASQINLGRLNAILFFPSPGDTNASGEFFLDDIELYPYNDSPGDCPQSGS